MPEEDAFIQAMLEQPNDELLRLVFADWLEERGDPRGELLRLTHTLTQSIDIPNRPELEARLRSLLAEGVQPIGPFWTNSLGMKFAWVPAGTFLMGSPPNEEKRNRNEIQHKVTLTKGFYLGVYLVTQEQWQAVMGNNPSDFKDEKNLPVEKISWEDCQQFATKLQKQDKKPYRLPTEAEWEYSCRAGTTTPFSFGDTITTDQANFNGNYGAGKRGVYRKKTTPVGIFPANGWGLYDMHGNVWELCQDWYVAYAADNQTDPTGVSSGDARGLRGGSWCDIPENCRAACRDCIAPRGRNGLIGIRVCFRLD